ncbi:hypothetical protein NLM33_43240 [Bradyrhizobium sp. CCGUVB1N3]|uniref:hypothetical protein n=1 Tax=Bradyrhizobium sp. CCGUVB1N3 TaxID=2949629 RepID=UPI0020B3157D|nr:hypothetical protein [Bradyrhizobium sp. CCGUVB1N3]MCP3476976.1 hypothetical protein [Bradyrhizobium sp. CCGUVB1N3]
MSLVDPWLVKPRREPREAAASAQCLCSRAALRRDKAAGKAGDSHDLSRDRREIVPACFLFGHNRTHTISPMQALAVISILALLTLGGAAISDQVLTADQQIVQRVE